MWSLKIGNGLIHFCELGNLVNGAPSWPEKDAQNASGFTIKKTRTLKKINFIFPPKFANACVLIKNLLSMLNCLQRVQNTRISNTFFYFLKPNRVLPWPCLYCVRRQANRKGGNAHSKVAWTERQAEMRWIWKDLVCTYTRVQHEDNFGCAFRDNHSERGR